MDHREETFVGHELVERIDTDLAAQDVLGCEDAFVGELIEQFVEESQHRNGRDIGTASVQHVRFEDTRFGEVVLVKR